MIPTQGRQVIILGVKSNGIEEQPAIITRAWSTRDTREGPVMVNLTVFPDCGMPQLHSSVHLFETAEEAHAFRGGQPGMKAAHWPQRLPDDRVAASFVPVAQPAPAGLVPPLEQAA